MPQPVIRHVTLTAGTERRIEVTGDYNDIAVLHVGNVPDDLWAKTSDTGTLAPNADDCYIILAGSQRIIPRPGSVSPSFVRLVCAGAARVEVEFS